MKEPVLMIFFVALWTSTAAVGQETRVGRYTVIAPVPTFEQRHPLAVTINITFPVEVRTVGQALQYLLARSGYSLARPADPRDPMNWVLSYPLPEVHRRLGPISLEQALRTLAGEPYQLQADHVTRQVRFVQVPAATGDHGSAGGAAPIVNAPAPNQDLLD